MTHTREMDKANEANGLWPPIADAVDTFLKRRATGADAYERIWRLIHVWEAISITLVGAGVSRVRDIDSESAVFRRCREHLHGRAWDSVTRSFNSYQGVFAGSAQARISILDELSAADDQGSGFLRSLKTFLTADQLSAESLVTLWARICDVPDTASNATGLSVRGAMRLINEFRNRIAHVPFPYDSLGGLADALEDTTERLFAITPHAWQVFPDEGRLENPMCGLILSGDRTLYGGAHRHNESPCDQLRFSYPPHKKPTSKKESWDSEPFLFVDSMLRPHVMTRLRGAGTWEFTRYRAEANAVIYHEAPQWQRHTEPPTESQYLTPEVVQEAREEQAIVASLALQGATPTDPGHATDFEQALRLIRNGDYEPAINYFAAVVGTRPDYHTGWLRLGHAQRELAMRRRGVDGDAAINLFNESIASLSEATKHAYPERRAQALYERSKAYFHRSRFISSIEDHANSMHDALGAAGIQPDTRYRSWVTYLKDHPPTGLDERQVSDGAASAETETDSALALHKSGKYSEGEQAAERAIRLNSVSARAWRALAMNRTQLGKHEEAREAMHAHDELLGSRPADLEEASRQALEDAHRDWRSNDAWKRLAIAYNRQGMGSEAIREAEAFLDIHPEVHESLAEFIGELIAQFPIPAGRLLDKMSALAPNHARYIHLSAVSKRKAAQSLNESPESIKLNQDAADLFRAACELAPRNASYWYALGRCLADLEDFTGAGEAYERALAAGGQPHLKAQTHLAELRSSGRYSAVGRTTRA